MYEHQVGSASLFLLYREPKQADIGDEVLVVSTFQCADNVIEGAILTWELEFGRHS